MDHRTWGTTKNCKGCRFWSEMIAQANGNGVEAYCLSDHTASPSGYTPAFHTCDGWEEGSEGAVDDPGGNPYA